jgi:hypothetical protein
MQDRFVAYREAGNDLDGLGQILNDYGALIAWAKWSQAAPPLPQPEVPGVRELVEKIQGLVFMSHGRVVEEGVALISSFLAAQKPVVTTETRAFIEPVMDLAVEAHQTACRMTRKEATLDDVILACDASAGAVDGIPELIATRDAQIREEAVGPWREALQAICDDTEAAYKACEEGRPVIEIGLWGRLRRARALLKGDGK